MRKSFYGLIIAALFVAGCQKEISEKITTESISFVATIEENDFGDTKTSLDDGGNVLWKKGDQESVFKGSTTNQKYQVSDDSDGKTTAQLNLVSFYGSGNEIENNVAFYPYQSSATLGKNGDNYIIEDIVLPSTQTYVEGSFGNGASPMVAVTSSTSDINLKFKNILGGLKLQLKGTARITSIQVKGNNNEILCGEASVTAANGSTPSINLTDESAKTVTLNCGTGVQLNTSTATPFVIALPPMTMTGGFTVVVRDSEGKEMEIKTTKSQSIVRSKILKMPVVNYEGKEPPKPLTFTATGYTELSLCEEGDPYDISLEYKLNDGDWVAYTIGSSISLKDKDQLSFQAGPGGNSKFSQGYVGSYGGVAYFSCYSFNISEGKVAASGNIMSLVDKDMKSLSVPYENYFCALFKGCTSLTTAPELPATTLASSCYCVMFEGCTSLTIAPELPATTLTSSCYSDMFRGCTSLTTAPELPATTLASSCYSYMFYGCTSLTQTPKLSATTLAHNCYSNMFYGCTSLTQAPELPATNLAKSCYYGMFHGCTSLTKAPKLSATTLASSCYYDMFYGCTSLTQAPELPVTTLADGCYSGMFYGCTSLTTAPKLPATTLADNCYNAMFHGCTSLTQAPELPVTTLAHGCYSGMFYGCTSLTTAPKLPATTLADYCYHAMFYGCTSLTQAPELPVTTLASSCYSSMFYGCTSLTKTPKLPATTLTDYCYNAMFYGCTSLTQASALPATTLKTGCYSHMFNGCTKLNYVKALFTSKPSSSYTSNWLSGVSSTGAFVKSKDATWDVRGVNGIPEGWTVQTE